jgi:hypothetical protein
MVLDIVFLRFMDIKKIKSAFSFLELSIVILVIGILIAGFLASRHLIAKSRLIVAQSMVNSSPINSISGNILWLESSLSDKTLGQNLDTGDYLTSWLDISYKQNKVKISAVGDGPTYSNSINYVHAVKFGDNSSNNYFKINDSSFLNETDYTIFILEKRISQNFGIGNYLIGSAESFALGYESENSVIQSHGEAASSNNKADIESLGSYSNKPRVMTFEHSSVGNKIYINATLANQDNSSHAKAHLSGLTNLAIGKGYNGEIGEIVIFNKILKEQDRKEVEDYLTKKWNAPNNRDKSTSCTNGIVTSYGCDASCAAPTINGVTSLLTISDGSSRSYNCDVEGYIGSTPTYACLNGSLSPTPAVTDCTANGCDAGYILSSGICFQGCNVATIAGTSYSGQSVANGTVVTCNMPNYNGANLGTCVAGNPISGTCGCASGYVPSSGSCVLGCSVANIAGTSYSGQSVASGTVVTCNQSNYDGSTLGTCVAGNSISGTCNCVSGYNIDSGSCKQKCTISASTIGLSSDVVVDSGSSSYNCSNSGSSYTGTVNYTCNNGSLSSVSGTCTFNDLYLVLTSGSSYTIPSNSGYANIKIWVIGGGGGGRGVSGSSASATGGGAGGVVYKTWSISGGETITYSIGGAGAGGIGNNNGSDGGSTSVTLSGTTITANGGKGGLSSGASTGGTYSGGDGGSNGGTSPNSTHIDTGSTGGGGIGGSSGGMHSGNVGGAGANSVNISSLFTALTSAGYSTTSGGTSGKGTGPANTAPGGNATGFGCGGGGAGAWGGNGGSGLYGGGGGGAAGEGTAVNGGSGGAGAIVIRLTN